MPLSVDQFAELLTSNGVLSPEEIEEFRRGFKGSNAEQFARELVRQKKLTAFQAQQCYSGRAKSLSLGNYVVIDKLGQGGMGMVLKAEHRRMKRLVAVKVLSPSVSKSAELVKRFQREVEAAARLTHPNIVAAYDSDEANGTVFLVMEYVEGKDLSSLVKSKGPLPVDRAIECILQAAKGLEYAHKCGIIHRDIKPANLLLSNEGVVKILDMGLARIDGEAGTQAELTNTGAVMGTVDYMAPEQAVNTKLADARSDIYALGISLWYLLVGRPAYEGDSLMARLLAHREAPIPSLTEARSGLPPALDDIFQKMVTKKPEDRFASMTEVIAALEIALQSEGATLSLTTGDSEAGKLDDFLRNLNDVSGGVSVTAPLRTRKIRPDAQSDATIVSSDSDLPTDPETLTRLSDLVSTPQTVVSRSSTLGTGWRDRRIQGALGGGLLLVLGLLFLLSRGKSPEVTQVGANPDEQVVVEQRPRMSANDPERPASQSLSAEGLASSSSLNDSSRVISASGTSQRIDLLPLVRTVSPHSGAPWTRQDGAIEIPDSGNTRTLIDVPELPDEYEIHMDVIPLRGQHTVLLGLVSPRGRFWIPIGGWGDLNDGPDGSTRIEPRPTGGTGTAETTGRVLFTNKKSSLVFTVRTDRVTVACDGKTLIDWYGDPATLQDWDLLQMPEPRRLGIGAWKSQMRITRLELRPLSSSPAEPPLSSRAPAAVPPPLTLVSLAPLNSPRDDAYPWPTEGGRTLFFTREGAGGGIETLVSVRSAPNGEFAPPTRVFAGRHAVVTNDLSYAVLFSATSEAPAVLHQSERNADTGVWSSPQIIAELAREPNVKSPWISQDGKTLVYQRTVPNVPFNTKGSTEFAISRREAPREPWSSPERLPMADAPELTRSVTWPCLSDDLLRIVFCHGGDRQAEVYMASRSSLSEPFGNYRPVLVDGRPLIARAPRWSPAGDELFVSMDSDPAKPEWDLYVLKGLPPEYQAQPASGANQESQAGDGWVDLFNGRDLTGWKQQGGSRWTVEDGVIRHRVESATDFLVSEASFEDFELSMEYRLGPDTDTGLFFRIPQDFGPARTYNEIQLLDETSQHEALVNPKYRTGSLWSAHRAPPFPEHGPGRWHTLHLIVQGDRFFCSIDGMPAASGTIRPDNPPQGSIAIQLFRGGIDVRRVRLREFSRPVLVTVPVLEFAEKSSVAIPPLDEDWNQPFTMELWVKRDPMSKNPRGCNLFQLSRQTGINLGYNEDFVFMYQFRKPGENLITAGSGQARPGEWFHVAAVRASEQMRFYVNGKRRSRGRIVDHGRADEGPPTLGGSLSSSPENIFRGQIASVRISRGELYTDEFTPPPMKLPQQDSTLLLYRIDEGQGDRLTDLSGHGHHGTIKGAQWTTATVPVDLARVAGTESSEEDPKLSKFALRFDGLNDYVDLTSDWRWDGEELTVDAWVIPEEKEEQTYWSYLFTLEHGTPEQRRGSRLLCSMFPYGESGELRRLFQLSRPPSPVTMSVDREPFAGRQPMLISFVWKDETPDLFVNGKRQTRQTSSYNFGKLDTDPMFWLGSGISKRQPTHCWRGEVLAFRIASRVLHTEDFSPPAVLQGVPDTEGLYLFREGQGDILHDSSGHNRHGKIHGGE